MRLASDCAVIVSRYLPAGSIVTSPVPSSPLPANRIHFPLIGAGFRGAIVFTSEKEAAATSCHFQLYFLEFLFKMQKSG